MNPRRIQSGRFRRCHRIRVAVGAESTGRTRDELVNVDMVRLLLVMPGLPYSGAASVSIDEVEVRNAVNNHIFRIEISMAPCSTGLDNPDVELYRRMAEQATALLDTL